MAWKASLNGTFFYRPDKAHVETSYVMPGAWTATKPDGDFLTTARGRICRFATAAKARAALDRFFPIARA